MVAPSRYSKVTVPQVITLYVGQLYLYSSKYSTDMLLLSQVLNILKSVTVLYNALY